MVGTADGDVHEFTATAVATGALTPGSYRWSLRAVDGDDVVTTIESGVVTIEPDLSAADSGDLRSHAEVMVERLESELQARVAGDGQAAHRLAFHSREFEGVPIRELHRLLAIYQGQLAREKHGGQLPPIRARFTRVS